MKNLMAFATRLVRPFRFASTATSSSTKSFLPSVSMLIERHNLEAAIVSKIPASGPKNNLLKGDILKFLKEGGSLQDIDEIISNEKYFQLQVGSLENEWLIALKKSVLFKRLSSAECTIAKISRNGEVLRSVDLKSETNTSKPFDRIRSGSFRFVDCLALGPLEEAPTFHTISGEAAVLSVHQIGSFANDTGLDFLTNSSSKILPSKPKAAINESQDLIDYLANTSSAPRAVRLELTVDGRVVSDKVATEYLREIRDLVDQSQ